MTAVDSAASGKFFPVLYKGEAHDSMAQLIPVGTTNDNVMYSVATDQFPLQGIPADTPQCYKFKEVTLPLVLVRWGGVGGNHPPLLENLNISGTEHPVEARPVFLFHFVCYSPVKENLSVLSLSN